MSSRRVPRLVQSILLAAALGQLSATASSQGGDYTLLDDLRIVATKISYLGEKEIEFFGNKQAGSAFSITADVRVQTFEAVPVGRSPVVTEVYETLPADFELTVVEDSTMAIHDEFVKRIHDTWSRHELYSGQYFFDFSSNGDQYVLTAMPGTVDRVGFYLFWVNGRAFRLTFKRFVDRGGLGVVDGFTDRNLRIRLGGTEVKAYLYPLRVRRPFLEGYREGRFEHGAKLFPLRHRQDSARRGLSMG